ncbi:MAG: protein kinase [Isosphaeraceae bacterium]
MVESDRRARWNIDEVIESFEEARSSGPVDFSAFLPPRDHPQFLSLLCELIRVDLEYGWRQSRPTPLEEYRRLYPELFEHEGYVGEVAFEEYRLRRQAGESATPDDYRERFRIDVVGWPAPIPSPASEGKARSGRPGQVEVAEGGPAGLAEAIDPAAAIDPTDEESLAALGRIRTGLSGLPAAGDIFLGFRLEGELGRGAFGRVYLARQSDLNDRPVALKVSADTASETHALAQLQHTNIVPIYSVHRLGDLQAVCMPYLGHTTLADVLDDVRREGGPLPESGRRLVSTLEDRRSRLGLQPTTLRHPASSDGTPMPVDPPTIPAPPVAATSPHLERLGKLQYPEAILWLACRMADGLAHAHDRGILHRDLKPANILFTDDGEPVLLDFNLAADTKLRSRATAALIGGTLPYMAPEHLEAFLAGQGEPDARGDIFAVGVILHELLTGRPPFDPRRGPLEEILPRMIADRRSRAVGLRGRNPSVTPAVESIVLKCLEPDPARRYQTARQLREDLGRQLDHRPLAHAPEPSLRERCRKWARRHPRLASTSTVALAACLLIAALSAVLLLNQRRLDRAEAAVALDRLGKDVGDAEFLLASRDAEASRIEAGIERSAGAVARYGIRDSRDWAGGRLVSSLPDGDREVARNRLGELLLLWARAESWKVEGGADPEARRRALGSAKELVGLAESAYGPAQAPRLLWLQKAEIARLEGSAEGEAGARRQAEATPLRSPRERLLLVPDLLDRGETAEALGLLEEAMRTDSGDFSTWLLRGLCEARVGRSASALDSYSVGVALRPGIDWAYTARGGLALERGDARRALDDFNRALELRPDRPEALMNRALARLALGDARGAVRDLDQALRMPGVPSRAWFIRARAHASAGEGDAARRDVEDGLNRPPTDALGWVARALARLPRDWKGALDDLEGALGADPRCREALQNKGALLGEVPGRAEEAIRAYDAAIACYPGAADSLVGRGVLLARLGRREAAIDDARRALALDDSGDTLYRAACIYALTSRESPEDQREALRWLAAAVIKDPKWLGVVPIDDDMAPIREAPEFRNLVGSLRATAPQQSAGTPLPQEGSSR